MPSQINLWHYLPEEKQKELIQMAHSIGQDTVYVLHSSYYDKRNGDILRRFIQLKKNTNKSNKVIYQQIANEISEHFEKVSPKAIEHVVSGLFNSRNF